MKNQNAKNKAPTTAELYPFLTPEQRVEVEAHFRMYIEFGLRVYERIRNDPIAYQRFKALTESQLGSKIDEERSILSDDNITHT